MHSTRLRGGRTHNLKGVSLDLEEGQLTCVTGVSGAGKSSLAVNTLYAEGQRRFVESFSPYARQFLERLERPPMDSLDPVAAGVVVDRRAPVKSSRSTVATLADVEAYLSALFARQAVPVCPTCHLEAVEASPRSVAEALLHELKGDVAVVTFPVLSRDTSEFLDARGRLLKAGFRRVYVQSELLELEGLAPKQAADATGVVWAVADRIKLPAQVGRLAAAIESAWAQAEGDATVWSQAVARQVRRGLTCPKCAQTFAPARSGLFSYQSAVGACATCRGFGRTIGIDWGKVFPDATKTLAQGAIRPWSGHSTTWERGMLERFARAQRIPMDKAWGELTEKQREAVLEGEGGYDGGSHYPGVRAWFRWMEGRTYKMHVRVLLSRYREYTPCATCGGARLNADALRYRVGGLDLAAWHRLELSDVHARLRALPSVRGQGELARRELAGRLGYLERVGLGYLTLDRPARTLSGGEAQRVSLTAALGTSLTGALFVLDEPTVGLHPADVAPLVDAMTELGARGNIALVIEHDPLVIQASGRVIELGPGAGKEGGSVCFDGTPFALAQRPDLPTGRLLSQGEKVRRERRASKESIRIEGAVVNNLTGLHVSLPLGVLCAVTGPSGSGKSTLIEDVLYRTLARRFGVKDVEAPAQVDRIDVPASIERVEFVDQSPLGRTSRGNAATYTKAWDVLRKRFSEEPEAAFRGLTAAHFSFNVAGGRCEACSGEGSETVEMQFLADVALQCPVCQGARFKPEVLAIRHGGHSVAQLLELSVDETLASYPDDEPLRKSLSPLADVGLGYLRLGQPLSTLSAGRRSG